MARFKASNRHAKTQIEFAHTRAARRPKPKTFETGYFRKIGFDVAML